MREGKGREFWYEKLSDEKKEGELMEDVLLEGKQKREFKREIEKKRKGDELRTE